MPYTVVFTPEAEEQLAAIYRYIAAKASPEIAERYTSAIVDIVRGCSSSHIEVPAAMIFGSGLRITNYKKRSVIAFAVEAEQVSIIGVLWRSGLRDYSGVDPDD